jgi:hypothetical protein
MSFFTHQILIKVCITPFLKTQLVDVEILVIVLLRMGNFGLMAVSMMDFGFDCYY